MVNRLKPFMDTFITHFQNAFVKGRNIIDNIIIAHKIFDLLRKKRGRKARFGALKIDMSKAYDRVNWNFLKAILMSMNFSSNWVKWIMECVSTVQYTLLINGSISQSFKPSRGFRQRDPLFRKHGRGWEGVSLESDAVARASVLRLSFYFFFHGFTLTRFRL